METKKRFNVIYSSRAKDFLLGIEPKAREKVIGNIRKSSYIIASKLFKKLDNTDIWEFRTLYNGTQYRLLAFWDKTKEIDTLVIATHGFIKKTWKTSSNEIAKATEIMKAYFEQKQ